MPLCFHATMKPYSKISERALQDKVVTFILSYFYLVTQKNTQLAKQLLVLKRKDTLFEISPRMNKRVDASYCAQGGFQVQLGDKMGNPFSICRLSNFRWQKLLVFATECFSRVVVTLLMPSIGTVLINKIGS